MVALYGVEAHTMLEQSLRTTQVQQQRLSPQTLQVLRMVQMSTNDLLQTIKTELYANPALEVDPQSHSSLSLQETKSLNKQNTSGELHDADNPFSADAQSSPFEQVQAIDIYNPETSLHDHLSAQLELCFLNVKEKQLAHLLISNLDENGFHILNPETFLLGYSYESYQHVLATLQSLDPVGIAVSNFQESLVVQARHQKNAPDDIDAFIYALFPLDKNASFKAKSFKDNDSKKDAYMIFLQSLNPFPGRQYSATKTQYIRPDAEIRIKDEKIHIHFFHSSLPHLRINPRFLKIVSENDSVPDSKKKSTTELRFAQRHINQGKQFLHSLELREKTSEQLIKRVIEHQKAYFLDDPSKMKVLKISGLAAELELSTSTISRIANTRYIQCQDGIHLLRFFFSLGTTTTKGSIARTGIKHIIRSLINQSKSSLSDESLRSHLAKQGIFIARRTVAKYRKELGMLKQKKRR